MDYKTIIALADSGSPAIGLWPSWVGKAIVGVLILVGVGLTTVITRIFPDRTRQIEIISITCGIACLIATAVMFNSGEEFLQQHAWQAIATLCLGIVCLGNAYIIRKRRLSGI